MHLFKHPSIENDHEIIEKLLNAKKVKLPRAYKFLKFSSSAIEKIIYGLSYFRFVSKEKAPNELDDTFYRAKENISNSKKALAYLLEGKILSLKNDNLEEISLVNHALFSNYTFGMIKNLENYAPSDLTLSYRFFLNLYGKCGHKVDLKEAKRCMNLLPCLNFARQAEYDAYYREYKRVKALKEEYFLQNQTKDLKNKSKYRLIKFTNGDRFLGEVKGEFPNGFGVYTCASGNFYRGDFADGLFNGIGKFYNVLGYTNKGAFIHNKLHGKVITFDHFTGTIYEQQYEMGKRVSSKLIRPGYEPFLYSNKRVSDVINLIQKHEYIEFLVTVKKEHLFSSLPKAFQSYYQQLAHYVRFNHKQYYDALIKDLMEEPLEHLSKEEAETCIILFKNFIPWENHREDVAKCYYVLGNYKKANQFIPYSKFYYINNDGVIDSGDKFCESSSYANEIKARYLLEKLEQYIKKSIDENCLKVRVRKAKLRLEVINEYVKNSDGITFKMKEIENKLNKISTLLLEVEES